MIPAPQTLWPLASAAAALAFLLTRPWRRAEGRLPAFLAGALIAADALWLLAASAFPDGVGPIALIAALLLIAFGATVNSATDRVDADSAVTAPKPVPRPSPCSNEMLLRLAIDQGDQAVAVSRFDGEMVFVNGAWARLHGLRAHEVTGHRWSLFHTPEQMHEAFRPLMAQAEAEGHHEAVIGRRRPDGTTFESRTSLTLVCDPETAAAIGWLALAGPLSGDRPNESVGESQPGDYSPAAIAFGRKVRETAHDFNNLLSAVVGNAGLVLEQVAGEPELQREIEEIESAAMRAAELATHLQTEARLVAPPGDPEVEGASGSSPRFEPLGASDPPFASQRPGSQRSDSGRPGSGRPGSASVVGASTATPPTSTRRASDASTTSADERPTILVVDNEKIVRDLARSVLEVRGYRVLLANDGPEALDTFTEHRAAVRAVLLDFGMPGMDGREVFDRLRDLDPGVRVVLMTGFRDRELVAGMERDGLAGSLPKPFRPAQLMEMLERVLAR